MWTSRSATGEIHAICGENGAGKSTLMKVLSGVYPHGTYEGTIVFNGEEARFGSINDSEAAGVVIIHQELALVPYLTVAENIFLGNERRGRLGLIDWNQANHEATTLMNRVGLNENPTTPVGQLGVGKQQLIEIAKALSKDVKLLILDEPTAALNDGDSEHLLNLLKGLQEEGITSIMISHKLNEIEYVADRTTIIRDGRTIESLDMTDATSTQDRIIRGMVGRDLEHRFPERIDHTIGDELLARRELDRSPPNAAGARRRRQRRVQRARGRGGRHRRAHGRGPHRARDEHLWPLVRPRHQRSGLQARRTHQHPHRVAGHRATASPTPPKTASATGSTSSRTSSATSRRPRLASCRRTASSTPTRRSWSPRSTARR